jgi:hypothetical protein
MLNSEKYTELIDSYLKGNLSQEEIAELESSISSNPTLKNEYELQKSIVETIRYNRKAELKNRLNNIEIETSAPTKKWWRLIAAAGLVASIGAWVYVQKSPTESISNSQELVIPLESTTSAVNQTTTVVPQNEETISTKAVATKSELIAKKRNTKTSAKKVKSGNGNEEVPNLPNLNAPEISLHEPASKTLDAPEGTLTTSAHTANALSGVEVIKSKKYVLHYRYFDKKLFLYGNFDAQTYDILELNTNSGQSFYLKFENNFYHLEPNKTEITKLEQINDADTISQLKEVQKK